MVAVVAVTEAMTSSLSVSMELSVWVVLSFKFSVAFCAALLAAAAAPLTVLTVVLALAADSNAVVAAAFAWRTASALPFTAAATVLLMVLGSGVAPTWPSAFAVS